MYRRNSEAAERARERRQKEDAAPRLAKEVPSLRTMRLSISFRRGDTIVSDASYVRVVVVPNAPLLFEIPCSDTYCQGGGHQLTQQILDGLKAKKTCFQGEVPCHGSVGSTGTRCTSTLLFQVEATFE
ncbi:MAG TPA: hypothetical protein VKP30_15750 [Polyangiaceae bacterium]|nr:hypothetical protein [Polyangiaceae bacterium]